MRARSGKAYTIGLKVVVVDMATTDEFADVNALIDYDERNDDIVLTVTHGIKDQQTAWVITWLAVPDHDNKTVDSGLITSAAAIRLLRLAPDDNATAYRALELIQTDYNRRKDAK